MQTEGNKKYGPSHKLHRLITIAHGEPSGNIGSKGKAYRLCYKSDEQEGQEPASSLLRKMPSLPNKHNKPQHQTEAIQ